MTTADPIGALREATRTMLQWQHRNLCTVVSALSADALNWTPVPAANSIAAIVVHTLDAERELVAAAAGTVIEHDGTERFGFAATSAEELLAMIDRTEQEINGYLDQLRDDYLGTDIARRGWTESGAWWLLHAVGHTREHVGQAQVTRQWWEHQTQQATGIERSIEAADVVSGRWCSDADLQVACETATPSEIGPTVESVENCLRNDRFETAGRTAC
jgi:uncharacterized damage-inducible protein DinB